MKKNIFTLFVLFVSFPLFSQEHNFFNNQLFSIHLKGGLNFNFHNLNNTNFDGSINCGLFGPGDGLGYHGEFAIEKNITDLFTISLSAAYFDRSADFVTNDNFFSRDLQTNQIVTVNTENLISTSISYFEIIPELKFNILKNFINGPLRFSIGPRLAIPITKQFEQSEKIASPDNAVFVNNDGLRTQNRKITNGELYSINDMQSGMRLGIENLLHIGNNNFFTQSISYDINFSNVTNDANWTLSSLNLTLGIIFTIEKPLKKEPEIEYEEIEKEEEKPIIVDKSIETPKLNLTFDSFTNMKIETGNELLATIPLVNAVFFDQNNSEISSFYNQNRIDTIDLFYSNPVEMHKYVMNRISKILNDNPKATVNLVSSTSGNDENNNLALSEKRANNVKNTLISLGVSENRIKTNSLVNPNNPSNKDVEEGKAENRRVEIIINNAPIQEYVDIQNYRRLKGTANYTVNTEKLDKAEITINENLANTNRKIVGSGSDSFNFAKYISENEKSFSMQLEAIYDNLKSNDTKTINLNTLNEEKVELNLDNFLAILLFEFDKSILSEENKSLIRQLSNLLPSGSTIELIGSADIIGTNEYNQELAKQRALNTEKFINQVTNNKFKIITKTMIDKFDDSTPQGRFLNRSIKIRLAK